MAGLYHSRFLAAAIALIAAGCSGTGAAPVAGMTAEASRQNAEKRALETAITPVLWVTGETPGELTLDERMARGRVPAVSIAVYRGGALDWAEGYGAGVDAETLFQAASLSKMVAATGIAALAKEKGVSLDADISADLTGIDMARLNPDGVAITLRGLLSNTNGATVSGFPGYAAGEPVPTTLQVIEGSGLTNTPAVVIRANPEKVFSYSGGGFTVAQYWAEQVSGEPFAAMMERLVLAPAGMEHSTFVQPLPAGLASGNVAAAYDASGSLIAGRWHTYPELAAAGLWTTASDFGRFLLALREAAEGSPGARLDPDVAKAVTTPIASDYGLGVGIVANDGRISLQHSGGNEGYRCYAFMLPAQGDAIVVMTNSDNGVSLYRDVMNTAASLYGWPSTVPAPRERVAVPDTELAELAGAYGVEGASDALLELVVQAGGLSGVSPFAGAFRLVPVGGGVFLDPEDGTEVRFTESEAGPRLSMMGMQLVKRVQ